MGDADEASEAIGTAFPRPAGGVSKRAEVADFWDEVLACWLAGQHHLVGPLDRWIASYQGTGRCAVDLDHYPDPYVGDLRGTTHDPRLVVLGLNPGVGYDDLQAPGGTWAERIRDVGYSHCFERSPAEDVESWVALHGKTSAYWAKMTKFAQRWLQNPDASVHDILNFELYPWHSDCVNAPMRPPPELIQQFVFDAVQEVDTPAVFAFGAPWFSICADLDLALVADFGPGCKASPVDAWPGWKLRFFELRSAQLVVVSAQPGFAGPPGPERLEVVRHLVSGIIRERRLARGSGGESVHAVLADGLSNLRPDRQLLTLTNRVAGRFDITAGPNPPHYVGVRPLLNGAIAGYVNKSFVDLQLNPERAKHFAQTMGWKLHKINSETGTLRIKSVALDDPAVMDLVVDLFVEALEKSEAGPSFEGGQTSAQKVLETPVAVCERHGLEKLGGRCDLCD